MKELLQQALDALEPISAYGRPGSRDAEQAVAQKAITALRQALAQPESEPSDREALLFREMRYIASISTGQVKRVANQAVLNCLNTDAQQVVVPQDPPYSNCRFKMCDLPGQCKGEGRCHHPSTPAYAQQVACSTLPELDASKPAEKQGLFRKFAVQRTDGSDQPNGKHHGCEYFVLDVTHDQHAPAALRAYAEACAVTHPQLSADLKSRWGTQQVAVPPTVVPAEVLAFLHGVGPLEGVWFGEDHPTERGKYWWRKHLSAAPQSPQHESMTDEDAIRSAIERYMANFPANCKNAAVEVVHAVLAHKGEMK